MRYDIRSLRFKNISMERKPHKRQGISGTTIRNRERNLLLKTTCLKFL